MKALLLLSLVQTVCIVFLIFKVVDGGNVADIPAQAAQTAPALENSANLPAQDHSTGAYRFPDESRLRQIIREELEFHSSIVAGADAQAGSPATSRPRNEAEDRYQKEYVDQQIAYYKSVGAITNEEMQDLQREIARLNKADQKEVLSKLMRALNSGEIKGQL